MKIQISLLALSIPLISAYSFRIPQQIPEKECRISGFAQGTNYHITYYASNRFITEKHTDSILQKLDSSLSIYQPYSIISRFNGSEKGIQLDKHLLTVIKRSIEINKATKGISDITIYPLMQVWGLGPSAATTEPDAATIKAILPCIGAGKIHLKGNFLYKEKPCIKIDLNGIAQGYSVDVVAAFLESNGIMNYIVEIGGELRIKGKNQLTGKNFRIGIESPTTNNQDDPIIKKIIQPIYGAVTTSGNYRKFQESNEKKISHLMNPVTGYPFQNELISVTVWAKDALTADGYDNALMGMGLLKSLKFLHKHKELEAYFIYRTPSGKIKDTASKGFYKMMINQ